MAILEGIALGRRSIHIGENETVRVTTTQAVKIVRVDLPSVEEMLKCPVKEVFNYPNSWWLKDKDKTFAYVKASGLLSTTESGNQWRAVRPMIEMEGDMLDGSDAVIAFY